MRVLPQYIVFVMLINTKYIPDHYKKSPPYLFKTGGENNSVTYAKGFSVGYLIPFGWLNPISEGSTPIYLYTSYSDFP